MGIEDAKQFLFQCTKWETQRKALREVTKARWGDISFYLGGKSRGQRQGQPIGKDPWRPNRAAIKATLRFVKQTGRFNPEDDNDGNGWSSQNVQQ